MKYKLKALCLILVLVAALSCTVQAATENYTTDDKGTVECTDTTNKVYKASYTNVTDGNEYFLFVVTTGKATASLQDADYLYVNQAAAANGKVEFANIRLITGATSGDVYLGGVMKDGTQSPVKLGSILNYTPVVKPDAPTLTATDAKAKTATVNLSWTTVDGATNYTVQRKDAANSYAQVYSGTATTFTDTNVVAGTEYTYRVKVTVSGQTSDWSSTAKATPTVSGGDTPTTLDAPTNLKAKDAGAATPTLNVSWNAVTGATGYIVERKDSKNAYAQVYSGSATSFADDTVKASKSYTYRVKAVAGSVESAWSATAKGSVALTAPTVPQNVKAGGSDIAAGYISVKWDASANAKQYKVYDNRDGLLATVDHNAKKTQQSVNLEGLTPGRSYTIYIVAVNGTQESANSAKVKASPRAATLQQPSAKLATDAEGKKCIQITWAGVIYAKQYKLERRIKDSSGTVINGWKTLTSDGKWKSSGDPYNGLGFTDYNIESGKTYQYRLRVWNVTDKANEAGISKSKLNGTEGKLMSGNVAVS